MDAIEKKQADARIVGREVFLRKIVMEGQVLVLNVPELREISALLGHCSGNLNQIAKRVNSTGRLYPGELSEMQQTLKAAEKDMQQIVERLTNLNQ